MENDANNKHEKRIIPKHPSEYLVYAIGIEKAIGYLGENGIFKSYAK